tara:strand:+ start:1003 stop:1776 length:774 start_codon:yes stop_codon:yes gene_type:complete
MQIRDRIKELRRVKASDLLPNPKNWRTHPIAQQDALRGVLAEVGYADALIARETPEGLMLVDGHLRAETTPDSDVPVLVLDINEAEADLMLATLDPLAAMAERDEKRLEDLLDGIDIDNEAVTQLLNNLAVTIPEIPEHETYTYTDVIETPIYEPTGEQPAVEELRDRSKAEKLIAQIVEAGLDTDIESFLIDAAERHVQFSFDKIANYYAHASGDVQKLIEESALVVIDYDQAISDGFVRLREDIDAAFHEDYPDA